MKDMTWWYKLFFSMFFCISVSPNMNAQDTLVLNDGTELLVKLLEIRDDEILYKTAENMAGPTYTTNRAKVFMAIYKDGKREIFSNKISPSTNSQSQDGIEKVASQAKAIISDENFEVRLIQTLTTPDKKKKAMVISADIEAYVRGKLFTKMGLYTTQAIDIKNSGTSTISIGVNSEKLNIFLWEKYENYAGKGYRWELPAHFFSSEASSCLIKFYKQKAGNKEILGFGGLSYTSFNLKDCSTLENKLLSVALIWLKTNFGKNN